MAHPLVEHLGDEFYADTERIAAGIERRFGTQWLELRQYLHDMRDRLEAL